MAKKKGNNGKKSGAGNIIIALEVLALLVVAIVLVITLVVTNKTKHVTTGDGDAITVGPLTTPGVDPNVDNPDREKIDKDYTTLAFFGVDARNGTLNKGTRTDTIIICSIDNETGDTRLCSVYRDTYLNTDPDSSNGSYQKANAAYAYGGPERAMAMLNANLDLYISKFVTVGFDGVMNTVDAVGGVDINIQEDEIKFLNDYQKSMYSTETKTVITDDYIPVTQTGLQTLSGYQALAYCRIRYTAGNDFKRTERQRDVVSQIVEKAKKLDPAKVAKICTDVSPYIATNMDLTEDIIPLASEVTKYTIVGSAGFPFADNVTTGLIGAKGDCVIPLDLQTNVVKLHEFLYPDMEYNPSDRVVGISTRIQDDTRPYIGQ